VKNEEVWHTAKEERNILCTIKWRKVNSFGHILGKNCLLKHVIEGMIEGNGRQGRKCKQLLDDLEDKGIYWNMNE
jgi:hypothetical protein